MAEAERRFADVAAGAARVAMGALGWAPGVFWSATPRDLMLATGAGGEGGDLRPLGHAELAAMEERLGDG